MSEDRANIQAEMPSPREIEIQKLVSECRICSREELLLLLYEARQSLADMMQANAAMAAERDQVKATANAPLCSCGRARVGYLMHPDGSVEYDEWCRICDDDGGRGDQ
jgi:hypothetical protein